MKMFCLEGMLLDKTEIMEKCIYLNVRSPRYYAICPHCANATKRVHRSGIRMLSHSILNAKIIKLKLKVRNFYCKNYGYYFRETFPGINQFGSTVFFRNNIILKIRDRSFCSVAKEHGLSASVARSILTVFSDSFCIRAR